MERDVPGKLCPDAFAALTARPERLAA
jgi:hypothetical protein